MLPPSGLFLLIFSPRTSVRTASHCHFLFRLILILVLATSGLDSRLKIWNLENGELLHSIDCAPGSSLDCGH